MTSGISTTTIDYQMLLNTLNSNGITDDDVIQDTMVAVLDQNLTDTERIISIAKELKRQSRNVRIKSSYTSTSLSKPLAKDGSEDFSLEDIIPAKEDTNFRLDEPCKHRRTNKYVYTCSLQPDAIAVLHKRYPGVPLAHAIRFLLGLSVPSIRQTWQEWENDILSRDYPIGGTLAVKQLLNRNSRAIRQQAFLLGIKFCGYKLDGLYTIKDLSLILNVTKSTISRLISTHKISSAVISNRNFVSARQLTDFLKHNPLLYQPELLLPEFRHYIPMQYRHLKTLEQASRILNVSISHIRNLIWHKKIHYFTGPRKMYYVSLDDFKQEVASQ